MIASSIKQILFLFKVFYLWILYLINFGDNNNEYLYLYTVNIEENNKYNFHFSGRAVPIKIIYFREKYKHIFNEIKNNSFNLIDRFKDMFIYTKVREINDYRLGFYSKENRYPKSNLMELYFSDLEKFIKDWNRFKKIIGFI